MHAQNKQRNLLNSVSEIAQFWFGIYSILVRNLLNSASDFTQFCFEFYSIWVVKVLNSKLQSAPKALVEEMRCAHDPSPAEPARFDSRDVFS